MQQQGKPNMKIKYGFSSRQQGTTTFGRGGMCDRVAGMSPHMDGEQGTTGFACGTPSELVIPISYGSSEVIETGKWGFQKPETASMTAPCQVDCPAGNAIPQFLYLAGEGRYEEALETLLKESPFPGVCGRVCFHPCESDCHRGQYDEAVSINAMERYVFDVTSDYHPDIRPVTNADSKQVAVVGSGPAGLSAAYFLRLLGYKVILFEAGKELGGVMRWGIPEYRLPESILEKEIKRILQLSIDVKTGVRVGKDISFEELDRFDAVFLSPGAGLSLSVGIEGEDLKKVWRGGDFLDRINAGDKIRIGKEIIVIGGGNTAMDVARSALRLGSRVTVAYRRTRREMPAIQDEIHEAEEEGVRFEFLIQPVKISLLKNKRVRIKFQRMRLRGRDKSNRPKAIPIKGNYLTLEADGLIKAVGEGVDLSWIPETLSKNSLIDVSSSLNTPYPKIFAGGDAIDQPRTIVTAIASGKKAAISIDLYLRGCTYDDVFSKIRVGNKGALSMETYLSGRNGGNWSEPKDMISYPQINTFYFEHSKRIEMRKLDRNKALKGFSEVNLGLTSDEARFFTSRCFSCGTCNYCYNCYFFCPEGVISLDPLHQTKTVDLDHCKGCGTCAKVCPRYVVLMKELS
jgi:NADPH-dependent glutamate synthase beta subunit-like oxidoreductase/Pyruvate/2-oxoacid:ferredoxin oxidoreductase delta subunit